MLKSKLARILILILIICGIATAVYAAGYTIIPVQARESTGNKYTINGYNLPTYVQYPGNSYSVEFYCLKQGTGFSNGAAVNYDASFNIRNISSYGKYASYLPQGNNLKKVMWILDNMYLLKSGTATERAEVKTMLLRAAGLANTTLSDEQISAVQQVALWHFTNPDHATWGKTTMSDIMMNGKSMSSNADAKKLYSYLINTAEAVYSSYVVNPTNIVTPKPASFSSSTVQVKQVGTDYVIGPLVFNMNGSPHTISRWYVVDQNGNTISNARLTTADGAPLMDTTLQKGTNYITIPGTSKPTSIQVKADMVYYQTTGTVWTNSSSYAKEQPLIQVSKTRITETLVATGTPPVQSRTLSLQFVKRDSSTGALLSGAQFYVSSPQLGYSNKLITIGSNGQLVLDITSAISANIITLTLKEVKAPAGYDLDDTLRTIVIDRNTTTGAIVEVGATHNDIISTSFANYPNYAVVTIDIKNTKTPVVRNLDLDILKVDSTNSNKKLSGAQFYLNSTALGYSNKLVTTDANGRIILSNISTTASVINLSIKEVKAPSGYELDTRERTITIYRNTSTGAITSISAGDGTLITDFSNTATTATILLTMRNKLEEQKVFDFQLIKVDSSNTNNTLAGARFIINGNTYTTDANGRITIFDLGGSSATTTLRIQEITAPNGYVLDSTEKVFTITRDLTTGYITNISGTSGSNVTYTNGALPVIRYTAYNTLKASAELVIKKVDQNTGSVINSTSSFYVNGGGLNREYVLPNGTITLPIDTDLNEFTLTIQERVAPTGYVLDTTTTTFTLVRDSNGRLSLKYPNDMVQITYSGEKSIITFTKKDFKKYDMEIQKIDATGNAIKNNPATFTVTGQGITGGTKTTDANGIINLTDLDGHVGDYVYTISEITPPDGYMKITTDIKITINRNSSGDITIKSVEPSNLSSNISLTNTSGRYKIIVKVPNLQKYEMEIQKVDGYTGSIITGSTVKFEVSGQGINGTETYVATNGIISIKNLDGYVGDYTYKIVEVTAPEGYSLDNREKSFTITRAQNGDISIKSTSEALNGKVTVSGNKITAKIPNYKSLGLEILKIDAVTGNAIENNPAKFTISDSSTEYTTNSAGKIQLDILDFSGEKTYTITEIIAPTGYILDKTQYKLVLGKNNAGEVIVLRDKTSDELIIGETTKDGSGKITIHISIKNLKKYDLEILKVDENGNPILNNPAKFEVTCDKSDALGERNFEFYTNKDNGVAVIPNITGLDGNYTFTIKELEAPSGYKGNATEYKFTINVNKSTGTITCNDSNVKIERDSSGKTVIKTTIKNEKAIFDLALKKFITGVNDKQITGRDTNKSDALVVKTNDTVVYTIRVSNEGNVEGYAKEIIDNVPAGLKFDSDNQINKDNKWTEANGSVISKALENTEIKPGEYKDVKIAFKVTETDASKIVINIAEINKDYNTYGVEDIDSTPGNNKDGEDDIDSEKIKVAIFDLELKKWVSKAIVTTNGNVREEITGFTGDEDPKKMVKIDINEKNIYNTEIKIVYKIKVTNTGEIPGYAKEIKDYIPQGMKFIQSDNPAWLNIGNEQIVTTQTENILLNPGESVEVEVVLTWINSGDNIGEMRNVAEISKDYNDSNTPDKDSTPGNNKMEEDDQDYAPIFVSILTGNMGTYIALTTGTLGLLGTGVFIIKRKVL